MALNFRAIVPMAAKATSLAGRRESLGDSSIMANILLIDPSAVAQLAMRGMLQRGHHRLAMVGSADEAWDFVERVVKVDLVFSELIIEGGGLSLAHRFKDDSFRKLLPFVFYSGNADRMAVKSALEMRVQNFLIKPYHEEVIYAKIAKATGIGPLMDVVERDPGLAAQMLIAANQTRSPSDESAGRIDDPQLAVGLLGKVRLVAQARGLVTIPESQLLVSTQFDWPKFWTYQNGVARLARQVCRYMEFHELESIAYTAGLLHDLGKLLFARLQPVGFQAVLEYARLEGVPLREAERKFIGCTTIDLATYWAEKRGLPRPFVNVIRWIETPRQATEDIDLVAVVSLARDFCRHNHVGSCGDPPRTHLPAIVESEEWRVLRDRVFPGFNLRKFELQAHADCHEAKLSLQGSLKSYAMAY